MLEHAWLNYDPRRQGLRQLHDRLSQLLWRRAQQPGTGCRSEVWDTHWSSRSQHDLRLDRSNLESIALAYLEQKMAEGGDAGAKHADAHVPIRRDCQHSRRDLLSRTQIYQAHPVRLTESGQELDRSTSRSAHSRMFLSHDHLIGKLARITHESSTSEAPLCCFRRLSCSP